MDRMLAVMYSIKLRMSKCMLSRSAIAEEWYALTRYTKEKVPKPKAVKRAFLAARAFMV